MSLFEHGKQYFKIKTNKDASEAFIPQGTEVSSEVLQWKIDDMNAYLKSQDFKVPISDSVFLALKKLLRLYPKGFKENFVILNGVPAIEPTEAQVTWLGLEDDPQDLVFEHTAFLRVTQPKPAVVGKDVFGKPIEPKEKFPPPDLIFEVPDQIKVLDEETYIALKSGQVELKGHRISFDDKYTIEDLGKTQYLKRTWPCSVHVKCDLEGNINWDVAGNLLVDGHWTCSNIIVRGDATAKSGIHTNFLGCLKVYGNLQATYVQMTRLGVKGNVVVDGSVLQCELRVGGSVNVRGSPGAIMGCTLDVFGTLWANKAGSDSGRRTIIRIHKIDDRKTKPTRIASLAKGTEMCVNEKIWIQETDAFYTD